MLSSGSGVIVLGGIAEEAEHPVLTIDVIQRFGVVDWMGRGTVVNVILVVRSLTIISSQTGNTRYTELLLNTMRNSRSKYDR